MWFKNSNMQGKEGKTPSQLVAFATITFLRINFMCKAEEVTIATEGIFKSPLIRNAVTVTDAVGSLTLFKEFATLPFFLFLDAA